MAQLLRHQALDKYRNLQMRARVQVATGKVQGQRIVTNGLRRLVCFRVTEPGCQDLEQAPALCWRQGIEPQPGQSERPVPRRAPAGDQQAATAGGRSIMLQQALRLPVVQIVEDQQTRHGFLPRLAHALYAFGRFQRAHDLALRFRQGAHAGSNLCVDGSRVGEADPENTASEKTAVAVHKFADELRFPHPPNGADHRRAVLLPQCLRNGLQLLRAPHKARIVCKRDT